MSNFFDLDISFEDDGGKVDMSKIAAKDLLAAIQTLPEPLKDVSLGIIYQKRTFSDIDDCIYCLDKLLTDPQIVSQTVNIGPDEECVSINQLYHLLSNKLKFNLEPKYLEDRPNEVKDATCSADKARKVLGYKTSVSLDESLNKIINYIKEKGPKDFQYNYPLEINNEKTPTAWKEKLF